jgi:predicted membrane protein
MRRDRHDRRENPLARLVTGVAVLAAGIIFWLDQIGRIDAGDYIRWWPLILIAYGLATLAYQRSLGGVVPIIFGLLFLPPMAFLPHLRFSQILGAWPLLISAAGVTLIAQALRPAVKDRSREGTFRAIAVMAGSGRKIGAGTLSGGDVIAVMGGCEIDLTAAAINREATIDVLAFWGGIEIVVPVGWHVENRVAPILGAFTDRTAEPIVTTGPALIVRGSAIMGGIEVRNPREATP